VNVRRSISLLAVVALSIAAPFALADDGQGLLLVNASPAGSCEIDDAVRGPSPIVARVAPGEHSVTCRSVVDGVTIVRAAKATVQAGKGTKVSIEMKVGP
jgi:hypothetical protein